MPELLPLGISFDPASGSRIDWEGSGSSILVNPEWARRHAGAARAAAALLPGLERHLWIGSSGSSSSAPGHVRWVALSKDAVLASARAVNQHLSSSSSDVWLHALPLFHVGGLGILARALLAGSRVVSGVADRWDAAAFRARALEHRATLAALVPSQLHDLVAARATAPGTLRAVVVGGARLEPWLYERARALGWQCLPSYGLTETASQVATAALDSLASLEYPVALPLLAHARARTGAEGGLEIRASSLLTCYAELTEEQARVWDPKRDGWFETGDLGFVHGNRIEVFGRSADSVKVLGETVWLERVEEAARRWAAQEPALGGAGLDLAVAAIPHARSGHELVLALAGGEPGRDESPPSHTVESSRPDSGLLLASVNEFVAGVLMPYERFGRVVWVEAIPRTALGKCRRRLLAGAVTAASTPPGAP